MTLSNTPPAKSPNGRRVDVSKTDIEWLRWLARFGYATPDHLQRRFKMSARKVRERLYRLRDAQLLRWLEVVPGGRKVWLPTSRALRLVRYEGLPTPTFGFANFVHNCAVLDIAITEELAGRLVLSERELNAARNGAVPTNEVWRARCMTGNTKGGMFRLRVTSLRHPATIHTPDLLVIGEHVNLSGTPGGGRWKHIAVEVELTVKNCATLDGILGAYRGAHGHGSFGEVRYLVGSERVGHAIQAAVERQLVMPIYSVKILPLPREQLCVPLPNESAPGPARTYNIQWEWPELPDDK